MNTSVWVSIIGLALSMVTTIVAVTVVIVQMRASVATLSREEERRQTREDAAAKEVTEFLVLLKSFISAQTEINRKVEAALNGVCRQVEGLEQHIQQASAIKELLLEIIKKKGIASIEP